MAGDSRPGAGWGRLRPSGNRWYPRDANPAVARAIRFPGSSAPFPNNVIPQSLINPVSRNLLTWKDHSPFAGGGFMNFPNVDAQARAAGSSINVIGTDDLNIDSDQYLTRIDHRFGANDRIFGRYVVVSAVSDSIPLGRVNQVTTQNRSQNLALGYSKIISPTVLNDLRYGFNKTHTDFRAPLTNVGFDQRALGLDFRVVGDNNRPLRPNEEGLPIISVQGFLGINYVREGGQLDNVYVHEFSDSLSVNRGKHNFKFGALYRYNIAGSARANVPRGQLNFTRDISGIPDGFAEFLLGFPTSSQTAAGQPALNSRQHKFGFYWLDDFKATSRLTINLGVRWDIFGHVIDQDVLGRIRTVSFAPNKAHTINGMFVPMLIPNAGDDTPLYDINLKQIMPRLGIAYRLTDRTVFRAGAGQFYNAQQMNNFQILNLQPPLSGSNVVDNDRTNPKNTIDNPFAGSAANSPTALLMLGNIQASRNNRSMFLNNNIWQWTAEFERSFGQNLVTGFGYLGSKGTHIDTTISNFNNPDPGLGAIQTRRPIQFYTDSVNPDKLVPLSTLRYLDSSANSSYHALQLRAEKRYAKGLTFVGSFNYQKAIGVGYSVNESGPFANNVPQNPRDLRSERARFNLDQRLRFVFSHVWELPLFRGAKGLKGLALGGWSVNGIIQFTSGFPVTVNQSGASQNTGSASVPRPNVVAGAHVDRVMSSRTLDHWFNTDAFIRSKCNGCSGDGIFMGPLGYGNAGGGLLDAPAQKTWDFALFKDFRVKEGQRVQFRWEAFNFLNTPQFSAPGRTLGDATFGRIISTITNNREMQFALKYAF